MGLRQVIRTLPLVGPLSRKIWPGRQPKPFAGSSTYWEDRYAAGGNSGAGSYNRLAVFKAEFLNAFVEQHAITSVIEFGSGDGAQLEMAEYPDYTGVDVSATAIANTRRRFADRANYRFHQSSELPADTQADLALSLDVIYHLVEDDVFQPYMRQLFAAARRFVVVYSSNEDKSWSSPHVRHRRFQTWIEQNQPGFTFVEHVPNRYPFDAGDQDNTSFADFWVFKRTA
jgi:hypothetical protein